MKRTLAVLCLLAFGAIPGARSAFAQLEPMRPREEAPFELSLSQEFNEGSQPFLVVSTSIPYRWLVFFVRQSVFESRYRVYMELRDGKGKSVRGEVWEEAVSAAGFKETTSPTIAATSRRSFPVAPGEYRVAVTIEVIDTSRRFSREQTVRIVGQGAGTLGVSAPVFYTVRVDTAAARPPAGRLVAHACRNEELRSLRINPGAIYGDFDSWVRFALTAAVPVGGPGGAALMMRVKDSRGRIVLFGRTPLGESEGGHVTLCVDVNVDGFALGRYEVNAAIEGGDGVGTGTSRGSFTVLLNRGLLGAHFGDLVEIITPIASDAERDAFAKAPPDGRARAWAEFWKKHDPTPATEENEAYGEFLERLTVVLQSFSKFRQGWLADMGKTYLKNGPPDKVEDRQNALGASYQLWYYHSKGIVYIFEDTIGNGDYRLYTTEMI